MRILEIYNSLRTLEMGLRKILFTLVLLGVSILIYGSTNDYRNFDTIQLQLKWKHQFQFAGYYAAIEHGFYKELGLNVNLIEAVEGRNPSDAVFNGNAEFGVCTSDILIMRSQNKEAVVLATIFQHSPQILVASQNSGIKHVQHLFGKRIAMEPNAADIIAFMNDEMISLDDCTIDDHKFNTDGLINGEIDAITAYSTDEIFILKELNFEYTIISPLSGGIDFYGDVLFTTESLIRDKPELVSKFREASIKGWEYALNNSEEIIDLIYNKYSKRHSKQHLSFEAEKMQDLIMSNIVEIGYSNIGRWNSIANTYKRLGMLEESFTTDNLLYKDYIKEKASWPWDLIFIFLIIIIFLGSLVYYFYASSQKLRKAKLEIKNNNITLKKINAQKDKMFSIIAHDLTSPFNVILGFSELILEESKDNSLNNLEKYITNINSTAKETQGLLQNLLEWTVASNTNSKSKKEKINLKELTDVIVKQTNNFAIYKKIKIQNSVPDNFQITADINMIKTVIRNLVSNALKFTLSGGNITISAIANSHQTTIIVSDDGIGINSEDMNKLFNLDSNYSRKGTANEKGSGLGLILCKEFIENHNGKIWVESELGVGSKFKFTLPKS